MYVVNTSCERARAILRDLFNDVSSDCSLNA